MNKQEIKLLKKLIADNETWKSISDDCSNSINEMSKEARELQKTVSDLTNAILINTCTGGNFEHTEPAFHFPTWVLELVPFPILKAYLEEHCPEED